MTHNSNLMLYDDNVVMLMFCTTVFVRLFYLENA